MTMLKEVSKIVRPFGLTVVGTNGHSQMWKDGKRVYTFAGSPKNQHQAIDNIIKDLIVCGYMPAGFTYRGKVYKKKLIKKTAHYK